jgi:transaldolase
MMATTAQSQPQGTAQAGPHKPLVALAAQGQSVWLDFITRDLVRKGELQRLIEQDGLRGMTSNPTIFQKAIADGNAYDEQTKQLIQQHKSADQIFEALAIKDIQDACDLFRPLYDRTEGLDGYVSIEVSPKLARDTQGTIDEARRLWREVNRPNVMVKVPGTIEGAPAVKQLLTEGLNINITLLFALKNHERVMWCYIEALEERLKQGQPINRIASVASFFVSRVDTLVDKLLDQQLKDVDGNAAKQAQLRSLQGKVAIANAKLAYARFREIFDSERFGVLRAQGARVQRPLWASTSTKNPAYRDVLYVEDLIGPDTVNTLPPATIKAFEDHGVVRRTIDQGLDEARATMAELDHAGIAMDAVTQKLEDEGVELFAKSFDDLLAGVEQKRASIAQQ